MKIGIIGYALVGFADQVKAGSDELVFRAAKAALDAAGITRDALDVSVITSIDAYDGITISNGLTAPAGGGYEKDATRIQGGGVGAIISACASILSKNAEIGIVAGADAVMYDDAIISNASYDAFFRRPVGLFNLATYGLVSTSILKEAGVTERDFALLAEKNYRAAGQNPHAHRNKSYSVDEILDSPMVFWPLRDLEIGPISKGGAALVLAAQDKAKELSQEPIWITGIGGGSNPYNGSWADLVGLKGLRHACRKAYTMAGIGDPTSEIDAAEVFNPFAPFEIPACEALGLCRKNEALELLLEEKKLVNTSGGALGTNPPACGGLFRAIQAAECLKKNGRARRAVVQDSDINLGFFGETYHVLVMEKAGAGR
jgi:acetyl-CoA acetyltransferase